MPTGDFPSLFCKLAGHCSGCAWLERPYVQQITDKLAALQAEWTGSGIAQAMPAVDVRTIASGGLRDRADVMIDSRSGSYRVGLYATEGRGLADMTGCPQFSPRLNELLARFREVELPIQRGSARLRVSPTGEFGVWLDLANLDVKALLDERASLDGLRAFAFVEVGQKRKALAERDGRLKLIDPVPRPWFETYLEDRAAATPVFTTVGGFTQPGFAANRALVAAAREAWKGLCAGRAAEFGSGSGNFTLPLAAEGFSVDAYELDPLACKGLQMGIAAAGLGARVQVHQGDFQRATRRADLGGLDLLFVDPPRSGLMSFLDPLAALPARQRPRRIVYVSCFAESFCLDAKRLSGLGYDAVSLALVDQFPQSPHFETVARFDLPTGPAGRGETDVKAFARASATAFKA